MTIERIDEELCNGCGICIESCSTDVLRLGEKEQSRWDDGWKAKIVYSNDCHSCGLCAQDCPVNAIYVSHRSEVPAAHIPY